MAAKSVIPLLVGFMLLTGVCNTLLTKYQDKQCVHNCNAPDPDDRQTFKQPVWQTIQMFIGEVGCWLVVAISALYSRFSSNSSKGKYSPLATSDDVVDGVAEDRAPIDGAASDPRINTDVHRRPLHGWKIILLALPATCDLLATTLMNVGLLFVAASIYQMTRGALVLFVGLFSVMFLRRRLTVYKWFALVVVVLGVVIVGLAGYLEHGPKKLPIPGIGKPDAGHDLNNDLIGLVRPAQHHLLLFARQAHDALTEMAKSPDALRAVIGVCLIALAQIFTASQFVLEEAIMERYALEPLKVVGWEGIFGLVITAVGMVILHFAVGRTPKGRGGYFDAREGWAEVVHNRAIAVSSILIMISIGGFNFFGLSVTRNVSATSRSTIDTCRTLFIWIASLGLGWETFKWLQVVGFAGLVYGTFLFNDIISPPRFLWRRPDEGAVLMADDDDDDHRA